jgi:toxin CptA
MAALAVIAILASGVSLLPKLLLVASVPIIWALAIRNQSISVTAVGWSPDRGWSLHNANGEDEPATLLSFRVLGAFILLRIAGDKSGRVALWFAPDNSDADIRRRLRMRLAMLQPGSKSGSDSQP